MSTQHVVPVGDLIEHATTGEDCPCGPSVEPVKAEDGSMGWVYSHHSLDGREMRCEQRYGEHRLTCTRDAGHEGEHAQPSRWSRA